MGIVLGVLLLSGAVQAADLEKPCPLEAGGFRVCNASLPSPAAPELLKTLEDPETFAPPGAVPAGRPVTELSQARLVDPADFPFKAFARGLYLVRGQLIQRVPGDASREEARALLRQGSDCARWIKNRKLERVEDSKASPRVYGVVCQPSVFVLSIDWMRGLRERDFLGPPRKAARKPAGSPPAFDAARAAAAARELPDDELLWLLERTGFVVLDSLNRVLVNGVLPYSPRTTPGELEGVMAKIGEEERVAVKELYDRVRRRALERAGPAPSGQHWVYDDYSGRAVLTYLPR